MVQLAAALADASAAPVDCAQRAALLSKTDLVTDMVLEFSDMQGIAGSYYALHDGEDADVASALAQQYWPKFAGDRLPETTTACALGLADRLDTLVGIFGIGQPPTGSKDPFALRRASLAVLRIMVEKEPGSGPARMPGTGGSSISRRRHRAGSTEQVLDYMIERFRAWYEEEIIPAEVFKAVSAGKLSRPLDIQRRVHAVHAFTHCPRRRHWRLPTSAFPTSWASLKPTISFGEVSANLLVEPQEKDLASRLASLAGSQGHLAGTNTPRRWPVWQACESR